MKIANYRQNLEDLEQELIDHPEKALVVYYSGGWFHVAEIETDTARELHEDTPPETFTSAWLRE